MKEQRKSNFELLRIVAMIIIVAHHFACHGAFNFPPDIITVNKLWVQFITIGGKIGVDIFVLITGYFSINSSKIKISKVLKVWLQLLFYSLIIYFIFVRMGIKIFDPKELKENILLITYNKWWFASTYFVLYIATPYINTLLKNLDKKTYRNMLIIMTVLWCLIPTFVNMKPQSSDLTWFFYLYCLAGYIRLWKDDIKVNSIIFFFLAIICIMFIFGTAVMYDKIGLEKPALAGYATRFYDMQQLPVLLSSLMLFMAFKNWNLGYSRFINIMSSATFGVYLIHDNYLVRPFLWERTFRNASYTNSEHLIIYSIKVILFVYIVCTVIELIRIVFFEKYYMKIINKFLN